MTPEVLAAAEAHAETLYPQEACGWIVRRPDGSEEYVRGTNVSTHPRHAVRTRPEDYAAAEDRGEVIAFVHSHPDAPARPSDADRASCEASMLPWVILEVRDGKATSRHFMQPCGYQAPLVGRDFSHGILDCYTLIRDWFHREMQIQLPDFDRQDEWWNDGSSSLYLDHFAEAGFRIVPGDPGRDVQIGDVALIQIRSKNNTPNHGAVYIGGGKILHHPYGRLSRIDVYGGMWLQYTRYIVRHRDLE